MTDDLEFDPKLFISDFTFIRFSSTLPHLFSSEFISFFLSTPFLIKSIAPFNEITAISLTIDLDSNLLLTLSKSLDQSTGLDASKPLVDSAHFDSSTRLLQFNLEELKDQKNRLERIQKNVAVLKSKEYACDFVAVIETRKQSFIIESLSKLGISAVIDESLRPKIIGNLVKTLPWPIKDEFDLKESNETLDLFEWIGLSLKYPKNSESFSYGSSEFQMIENLKHFSIEGQLLPSLKNHLAHLATSSTRLIFSLKVCQKIPPPFDLNSQRLKHFNERKFDGTACTADQMALSVFKSPLQTLTFKLNSTS